MSRNGSGTYNLPAGNPVVTGTTISSTWANNTLSDMANAITGSIAADGQTTITGPLKGPNGTVSFAGVGQTKIPSGTTAQRASSPVDGMIRYNTDIQQYEGYKNGAWSIFGNGAGGTLFSDTVTATQGQTVITMPTGYVLGGDNLSVYVNGSRQIYNVNYTETNTTSFTFVNGLNAGDLVNYTIGASTSLAVNAASVLYNEGGVDAVDQNVEQKLQEIVSVKDFGAVGDGIADDTEAVQAAFTNAALTGNTLFISFGTYRITSQISVTATEIFNWSVSNAKIFVDSDAPIESAIKIEIDGNNIFLNGNIEIDCNNNSYAGILVLNNNALFPTCVINGPIIRNVYRSGTAFNYGDGIYVFGAYERVVIRNFEIHSVKMAVGAGVPFSYGVTGVTVFRFNNSTRDAESVLIEDFYIDKVYSEDVTYGARDQDGIRVTQAYEKEQISTGTNPVFALVQNGRIKNAHGRAVKMVSEYGIVQNIEVVRDTTIYSSFSPGSSEDFDFQVSGGSLSKIRCYYNNNCPQSISTFAVALTSLRRSPTKVDISDVIVSAFGSVYPKRLAEIYVVTAPVAPASIQINITSIQFGGALNELDEVVRLQNINNLPDTFIWSLLLTSVTARVTNSFVYREQATIDNTVAVTGINCMKSNSTSVPLVTGTLTTNIFSFLVGYNLRLT